MAKLRLPSPIVFDGKVFDMFAANSIFSHKNGMECVCSVSMVRLVHVYTYVLVVSG